jgi:hypothetical protein
MRKVILAVAPPMVALLVYAHGVTPAEAVRAGSGFSQACKDCFDKCDKTYPRGGGPLATCKKLCGCKKKLQIQQLQQ